MPYEDFKDPVETYNDAFQKTVWTCGRFRQFLANLTEFDGTEPLADISAAHRWKRRSSGLRSTADFLVILYSLDTKMRLALFVEHKFTAAGWDHSRPKGFELRSVRCNEFQTVLIAPGRLIRKQSPDAEAYDIRLAYEDVSDFVPVFADEIDDADLVYQTRKLKFPKGGPL